MSLYMQSFQYGQCLVFQDLDGHFCTPAIRWSWGNRCSHESWCPHSNLPQTPALSDVPKAAWVSVAIYYHDYLLFFLYITMKNRKDYISWYIWGGQLKIREQNPSPSRLLSRTSISHIAGFTHWCSPFRPGLAFDLSSTVRPWCPLHLSLLSILKTMLNRMCFGGRHIRILFLCLITNDLCLSAKY